MRLFDLFKRLPQSTTQKKALKGDWSKQAERKQTFWKLILKLLDTFAFLILRGFLSRSNILKAFARAGIQKCKTLPPNPWMEQNFTEKIWPPRLSSGQLVIEMSWVWELQPPMLFQQEPTVNVCWVPEHSEIWLKGENLDLAVYLIGLVCGQNP